MFISLHGYGIHITQVKLKRSCPKLLDLSFCYWSITYFNMNYRLLLSYSLCLASACLFFCINPILGQGPSAPLIQKHLNAYASEQYHLSKEDVEEWILTNSYTADHNGVTYLYLQQSFKGISIYNAIINMAFREGKLLHMGDRFQRNVAARANATQPGLSPEEAIAAAAVALKLGAARNIVHLEDRKDGEMIFSGGNLSQRNIPVKLSYQPGPEGELSLAWNLAILQKDGQHWWSLRVDAQSGKLLDKNDWMVNCTFPDHEDEGHSAHHRGHPDHFYASQASRSTSSAGSYRVFPYYTESPTHGPRVLIQSPSDSVASPFGWHDTDGVSGAEHSITRGNNVWAFEDTAATNSVGYSPDGGISLNFDFPINFNLSPRTNLDAAITNLFYMNNALHDILYFYGFTEAAGNFQENNYSRGGAGQDEVFAQAQDGGGLNNANFGTPPDGLNPAMQMFLWTGTNVGNNLTIHTPSSIAGGYSGLEAGFGPGLSSTALTADLVLADDNVTPDQNDLCEPPVNAADFSGRIAVIRRGSCSFVQKITAAQNAGALAVIMVNNVGGGPITMGGNGPSVTIPSIMISRADGNSIISRLVAGDSVSATLVSTPVVNIDGDYDNGIIAHEYGHGVSNRLTGGPAAAGCLSNNEQMGEGWSDYLTLMFALDTASLERGIGTYATSQPTTGVGIRPARYSRNRSVNGFTYANTNSGVSQPHGIGFVWCTMLWDMTLSLIDQYGFDPDIYRGNGGNNIALQLVMDGMALQPCGPGFVDGRDAILMADQINNGGANQCLIWKAFAERGLGVQADQGSPDNRSDQTENFDLPSSCLVATAPPIANYNFTVEGACGDEVSFEDISTSIPQFYRWDFGDGSTDTVQNPTHVYTREGSYTVRMVAINNMGTDTVIKNVNIVFPPGPTVQNQFICKGQNTLLQANGSGQFTWFNQSGDTLFTGSSFLTPALTRDTTFFVNSVEPGLSGRIGPTDGSFSAGGYHNTGFTGTLNFDAFLAFDIVSVWIDAGSPGPRTIFLWDDIDGSGNIVDQVTIDVPAGPQRVSLDLEVPGPGRYSIGGSSVDLFRNSSNAAYPYEVPGMLRIFSSSATTGPLDFYYYLYDWEVEEPKCPSERVAVDVSVARPDFSFIEDSSSRTFSFADESKDAISWLWDFGDGSTDSLPNPIHTYALPGEYIVRLTINGSCSYEDTLTARIIAGLEENFAQWGVKLLPNPASNQTLLSFDRTLDQDMKARLMDLRGKILSQKVLKAGSQQIKWDLKDLSPGIYLLQIEGEGDRQTLRLLVE